MSSAAHGQTGAASFVCWTKRRIYSQVPLSAGGKTVDNAFVVSRVDNCNGLLAGITQKQPDRLQSIMNASAKVLYGGTRRDQVTPLCDKFH